MIPQVHDRQVVSNGNQPGVSFGISTKDSAHLMTILRDTLYSDKVAAVLREYGANAKDAHVEAGIKDRPIEVKLPTNMEPTLEIRDYGLGLSHEQVFTVFSQYGASTKRTDNEAIGYLGIGSKSGFAYSDSFTIVSRNGGMCRTYVAVLDATEQGEIRVKVSQREVGEQRLVPGLGLHQLDGLLGAAVAAAQPHRAAVRLPIAAAKHKKPSETLSRNVDQSHVSCIRFHENHSQVC